MKYQDHIVRRAVGSRDPQQVIEALQCCETLSQVDDMEHFFVNAPAVMEATAWCVDLEEEKDKQKQLQQLEKNTRIFEAFMEKFWNLTDEGSFREILQRKDYRGWNLLCAPLGCNNVGMLRVVLPVYKKVFGGRGLRGMAKELLEETVESIGEVQKNLLRKELRWTLVPDPTLVMNKPRICSRKRMTTVSTKTTKKVTAKKAKKAAPKVKTKTTNTAAAKLKVASKDSIAATRSSARLWASQLADQPQVRYLVQYQGPCQSQHQVQQLFEQLLSLVHSDASKVM